MNGTQGFAYNAFLLHGKQNKSEAEKALENQIRKENPLIDQMLYEADKAEMIKEITKARELMLKAARGEALTPEEERFLKEKYPEYYEKANKAKQEAQTVKNQLKAAKTKEAKQQIMTQATQRIATLAKHDSLYAEAFQEAIKAVEQTTNKEDGLRTEESNQGIQAKKQGEAFEYVGYNKSGEETNRDFFEDEEEEKRKHFNMQV